MDGGLKNSSSMYSIYTVKHSEATPLDLDRAISLKSVAWPYPKESQIQWMRENLKPADLPDARRNRCGVSEYCYGICYN